MLTRNHSILIVDNVSERRQHLKAMLFERDDSILEAETSEAALDLMKESPVDLIITETELSTRSGLYLLQEIKKHYPETEVILTTHNASSFNLLQALRQHDDRCARMYAVVHVLKIVGQLLSRRFYKTPAQVYPSIRPLAKPTAMAMHTSNWPRMP